MLAVDTGITIITHGWQALQLGPGEPPPAWTLELADGIAARAGGGRVFLHDNEPASSTYGDWVELPGATSLNSEIILVYNWTWESDDGENGWIQAAADQLFASLLENQTTLGGQSFFDVAASDSDGILDFHFIGHSRGAVLNSLVVNRFAQSFNQYQIDQVTTLDPHPILAGVAGFPAGVVYQGDPSILTYENVVYADNYFQSNGVYQNDLVFDGVSFEGTRNVQLTNSILQNSLRGVGDAGDGGYETIISGAEHSDVHLWYAATVSPSQQVVQGIELSGEEARGWWESGIGFLHTQESQSGRANVGFARSRISGGDRSGLEVGNRSQSSVSPVIFNGDFSFGDTVNNEIPGWERHGGSHNAELRSLFGRPSYARLTGPTARLEHNLLYVPVDASELTFRYRKPVISQVTTGGTLVIRLGDGDPIQINLDSIAANEWKDDIRVPIPQGIRGKTTSLSFKTQFGEGDGVVVDLDDISFKLPAPTLTASALVTAALQPGIDAVRNQLQSAFGGAGAVATLSGTEVASDGALAVALTGSSASGLDSKLPFFGESLAEIADVANRFLMPFDSIVGTVLDFDDLRRSLTNLGFTDIYAEPTVNSQGDYIRARYYNEFLRVDDASVTRNDANSFSGYFNDAFPDAPTGSLKVDIAPVVLDIILGVDFHEGQVSFYVDESSALTIGGIELNVEGGIGFRASVGNLLEVSVAGPLTGGISGGLAFNDPDADTRLRISQFSTLDEILDSTATGRIDFTPRLEATLPIIGKVPWNGSFWAEFQNGVLTTDFRIDEPDAATIKGLLQSGLDLLLGSNPFDLLGGVDLNGKLPVVNKGLGEILGLPSILTAGGLGKNLKILEISETTVEKLLRGDVVDLVRFDASGGDRYAKTFSVPIAAAAIPLGPIPLTATLSFETSVYAGWNYYVGFGIDTSGFYIDPGTSVGASGGIQSGLNASVSILGLIGANLSAGVGASLGMSVGFADPDPRDGRIYLDELLTYRPDSETETGELFAELPEAILGAMYARLGGEAYAYARAVVEFLFFDFTLFDVRSTIASFSGQLGGNNKSAQENPQSIRNVTGRSPAGTATHLGLVPDAQGILTITAPPNPDPTNKDESNSIVISRLEGEADGFRVAWRGIGQQDFRTGHRIQEIRYVGNKAADRFSVGDGVIIPVTAWGNDGDDIILVAEASSTIYGGAGNDMIRGGSAVDTIYGEGGHDQIYGGSGNDFLYGQAGNDYIEGGGGVDYIYGGIDHLGTPSGGGESDFNTLLGESGKDYIYGGSEEDVIDGGTGDDEIFAFAGRDVIYGEDGNDLIDAGAGNDLVFGGFGDDELYGGDGDDLIFGDTGYPNLTADGDYDGDVDGSDLSLWQSNFGNDSPPWNPPEDYTPERDGVRPVERLAGDYDHDGDVDGRDFLVWQRSFGQTTEVLTSEDGNDKIHGDAGDDRLFGEGGMDDIIGDGEGQTGKDLLVGDGGMDTLTGGAGDDALLGGDDVDKLYGNDGDDTLNGGKGADTIDAGNNNDTIQLDFTSAEEGDIDAVQGGLGIDQIILAGSFTRSIINGVPTFNYDVHEYLQLHQKSATEFDAVRRHMTETLPDGTHRELERFAISTNGLSDIESFGIHGLGGNDTLEIVVDAGFESTTSFVLNGGAGNDTLLGGPGKDTLFGGPGEDKLFGLAGNDVLYGDEGRDLLDGGDGVDSLYAGAGGDIALGGYGREIIRGGPDNDILVAGSGYYGSIISGGDGDDVIIGSSGIDTIDGDGGNDIILGGDFGDVIRGGSGNDTIVGELGRDDLSGDDDDDILFTHLNNDIRADVSARHNLELEPLAELTDEEREFRHAFLLERLEEDRVGQPDQGIPGLDEQRRDLLNIPFAQRDAEWVEKMSRLEDAFSINILLQLELFSFQSVYVDKAQGNAGRDKIYDSPYVDILLGGDNDDDIYLTHYLSTFGSTSEIARGEGGDDTLWFDGTDAADRIEIRAENRDIMRPDVLEGIGNTVVRVRLGGAPGSLGSVIGVLDEQTTENIGVRALAGDDEVTVEFQEFAAKGIKVDAGIGDDIVVAGAELYAIPTLESKASLFGGPGDDRLYGGNGDDYLRGDGGDDYLSGGPGNDIIEGDQGTDQLYGAEGSDRLYGGLGHDFLHGGVDDQKNYLYGGAGDDTLISFDGVDYLDGGEGIDSLDSGAATDIVIRRPESDNLQASTFEDDWEDLLKASSGDIRVNLSNEQLNGAPSLAVAPDGSYVVAWSTASENTKPRGIYAQRYDVAGSKIGAEIPISTFPVGFPGHTAPSVALSASGVFVVTWQDRTSGDIYARRFDGSGPLDATELKVNTSSQGVQGQPSVAVNANDRIVISWISSHLGSTDVFATYFSANATTIPAEFSVATGSGVQEAPQVVIGSDNSFIVAWISDPENDGSADIYFRRWNLGVFAGTASKVNSVYDTFQGLDVLAIALADNGEFLIAWDGSDFSSNSNQIIYKHYLNPGFSRPEKVAHSATTSFASVSSPGVSIDSEGRFIVTWSGTKSGSTDRNIYARLTDPLGFVREDLNLPEIQINDFSSGNQSNPSVGISASGDPIFAWSGDGPEGSGAYVRRFNRLAPSILASAFDNTPLQRTIRFSERMSPAASMAHFWKLKRDGVDVSEELGMITMTYDAATGQTNAVVSFKGPLDIGNFELIVSGEVTDEAGRRLDGNGDGLDGDDYVESFTIVPPPTELGVASTTNLASTFAPSNIATAINPLDHSYVTVWEEETGGILGTDIVAQRFNFNGVPAGPRILVNTYQDNGQSSPAIAMDESGNFIIVWDSIDPNDPLSGKHVIHGQIYSSDGDPLNSVELNMQASDDATEPSVVMIAPNTYAVVWQAGSMASGYDVYFERVLVGAGGENNQVPLKISRDTLSGSHQAPQVVLGGFGEAFVIWDRQQGAANALYGSRFGVGEVDGVASEPEPLSISDSQLGSARIAMNRKGEFIVFWRNDIGGESIGVAQRYDSSYRPIDDPFIVSRSVVSSLTSQSVGIDDDGNVAFAWIDNGLHVLWYDNSGNLLSGSFESLSSTAATSEITVAADGEFIVSWSEPGVTGAAVRTQRFTLNEPTIVQVQADPARDQIVVGFSQEMATSGAGSVLSPSSWGLKLKDDRYLIQDDPSLGGESPLQTFEQIRNISFAFNTEAQRWEATIQLDFVLTPGTYELIARSNLKDASGRRLSGNANGSISDDFIQEFTVSGGLREVIATALNIPLADVLSELDDNLLFWLDATRTGTVDEVDGRVVTWSDSRGASVVASQTNNSAQPILDGKWIRFNSHSTGSDVNDALTLSLQELPEGAWTATTVFEVNPGQGGRDQVVFMSNASFGPGPSVTNHGEPGRTAADVYSYFGNGSENRRASGAVGAPHSVVTAWNGDSSDDAKLLWVDGIASAAGADLGFDSGVPSNSLAGTLHIGSVPTSNPGGPDALDGAIGAIILHRGTLSLEARQQLEAYLALIWGSALPSNHPYFYLVSEPGDFDGDSDVDGRDFLKWQRGESSNPLSAADLSTWQIKYDMSNIISVSGNLDLDGDVDGRDFLAWQRNPSISLLSDWQNNYGTSGSTPPTTLATTASVMVVASNTIEVAEAVSMTDIVAVYQLDVDSIFISSLSLHNQVNQITPNRQKSLDEAFGRFRPSDWKQNTILEPIATRSILAEPTEIRDVLLVDHEAQDLYSFESEEAFASLANESTSSRELFKMSAFTSDRRKRFEKRF